VKQSEKNDAGYVYYVTLEVRDADKKPWMQWQVFAAARSVLSMGKSALGAGP
jgi:hypothetical protein